MSYKELQYQFPVVFLYCSLQKPDDKFTLQIDWRQMPGKYGSHVSSTLVLPDVIAAIVALWCVLNVSATGRYSCYRCFVMRPQR